LAGGFLWGVEWEIVVVVLFGVAVISSEMCVVSAVFFYFV
jgi:hypothetical protein